MQKARREMDAEVSDIVLDVSSDSLARANEANLMEGFTAGARAYGGEVADEPDLLWCAWGIPGAGWNRVLRSNLAPETLDARVKWVQERARALHTAFLWQIGPSTQPGDLGDHLLRHGFTDAGDQPAMGVALAQLPQHLILPAGVVIERVRDHAALEQWVHIANESFGAPPSMDALLVAAISRDTMDDSAVAEFYLASLDGEPVATAALLPAAGVAGIFSVATLAAARGHGIGSAITIAPLLAARGRGYAVGVLQASEMGYPVYARMGFTEQFRYHCFHWQPD
jgi:GNAT superfamily N-acetyltransferase